jgi:hypothetical protein
MEATYRKLRCVPANGGEALEDEISSPQPAAAFHELR